MKIGLSKFNLSFVAWIKCLPNTVNRKIESKIIGKKNGRYFVSKMVLVIEKKIDSEGGEFAKKLHVFQI